jgi:hypothetical protein
MLTVDSMVTDSPAIFDDCTSAFEELVSNLATSELAFRRFDEFFYLEADLNRGKFNVSIARR